MYVVSGKRCSESCKISTIQEHIACAGKPISALILGGSIEAGADLQNPLDSYFVRLDLPYLLPRPCHTARATFVCFL